MKLVIITSLVLWLLIGCTGVVIFGDSGTIAVDVPLSSDNATDTDSVIGGQVESIQKEVKNIELELERTKAEADHLDWRIDRGKERDHEFQQEVKEKL